MSPGSALSITGIADAVHSELERRILDGIYKPGDRLPGERSLSESLGVSRTSVREAIKRLVSKGWLITRHGGGTFVTDRLSATFTDPWSEMLAHHPQLQGDMLEFRHILESKTAYLAAERATAADLSRLDEAVMRLDEAFAGNDVGACIDADVAFHQVIAESSHNALIDHLTESLLRVIHGHITRNLENLHAKPVGWAQLETQHHAIWQAIRTHQPEVAERAAIAHIDFVRENMAETQRQADRLKRARLRVEA